MTRFSGWLLVTLGVLWLALTGLCTLFFAWITAEMGAGLGGGAVMAGIGLIPMSVGLVPLFVGRWLLRRARQEPPP